MTKGAFEARIQEICEIIGQLPPELRSDHLKLVEEMRQRFASVYGTSQAAQDALDDLRLRCKYSLFDAEATRRESRLGPDQRAEGPPL